MLSAMAVQATVCAGCRDDGPGPAGGGAVSGRPETLKETYDFLRACRASRAYLEMRPYVDPAAYRPMVDLLLAVDELLAANQAAMELTSEVCPEHALDAMDLSRVADELELFSREVTWIRGREGEDRAVVTVQVADRLPVIDLAFVRYDDRWVYEPDLDGPDVAPALRGLARAVEEFTGAVRDRSMTCDQVIAEYMARIGSHIRRLTASDEGVAARGDGAPAD